MDFQKTIQACSFVIAALIFSNAVAKPEQPAIMRNVTAIQEGKFQYPHLHTAKTTQDGRIGIEPGAGSTGIKKYERIFLNKPEAITSSNKNFMAMPATNPTAITMNRFDDSGNSINNGDYHLFVEADGLTNTVFTKQGAIDSGKSVLKLPEGIAFIDKEAIFPGMPGATHRFICEAPDEVTQTLGPQACGEDDCYEFYIMAIDKKKYNLSTVSNALGTFSHRIVRQQVNLRVANPKTEHAYIKSITLGDVDAGPEFLGGANANEPAITADGKLIVYRLQDENRSGGVFTTETTKFDTSWEAGDGFEFDTENQQYPANLKTCEEDLDFQDTAINTSNFDLGDGNTDTACPRIDIVYTYNAGSACDVTGWDQVHPVSHAYFDNRLNPAANRDANTANNVRPTYGFAAYPFRAPDSTYINGSDGTVDDKRDINGSYAWVDPEGDNLIFMIGESEEYFADPYFDGDKRCVEGVYCDLNHQDGLTLKDPANNSNNGVKWGMAVAGLWTQGKTVYLDSILNNVAFGLEGLDTRHIMLDLYQDEDGDPVSVRLGTGRWNTGGPLGMFWPIEGAGNTDFMESIVNRWNAQKEFQPALFRDVVWKFSNAKVTDEIAFDDYLNPAAYIVSEMGGARTHAGMEDQQFTEDKPGIRYYYDHHDGWDEEPHKFSAAATKVQNAATTLPFNENNNPNGFNVPAYGDLYDHDGTDEGARIEPAALGGISGRGLWLEPEYGVHYASDADNNSNGRFYQKDMYVGLFLDARMNDDGVDKKLITFPDGSSIRVKRQATATTEISHIIFYDSSGDPVNSSEIYIEPLLKTAIAKDERWIHFGFQISYEYFDVGGALDQLTETFINGYKYNEYMVFNLNKNTALFNMDDSGDLVLGENAVGQSGIKGWVDEFKVLFESINVEVACNHARGTLIGVDGGSPTEWKEVARKFGLIGSANHKAITDKLSFYGRKFYEQYACYHDYARDYGATKNNIPQKEYEGGTYYESYGVRDSLLFPEGPLYHDDSRPLSSNNNFCTSCHHVNGKDGLGMDALDFDSTSLARTNPRRQPTQSPQTITGNIPEGWLGYNTSNLLGSSLDSLVLPSTGADTDLDGLDDSVERSVDVNGVVTYSSDPMARDTDNDGILDGDEAAGQKLIPNYDLSKGDEDSDGDGVANGVDAFPLDATEDSDSDGDGVGDNADNDDNDAAVWRDSAYVHPADIPDADGDGVPDSSDDDPDNDGVLAGDNCPLVGNVDQIDEDGDGKGDACDDDIDGDGMPNIWEWLIGFGVGYGPANQGPNDDTDGDGVYNIFEYYLTLNPASADSDPTDGAVTDGTDSDSDGIADVVEIGIFCSDPNESNNEITCSTAGNDLILSGPGDDFIANTAGDDTISYGIGDGNDTISVIDNSTEDILHFEAGILYDDLLFERDPGASGSGGNQKYDLVIKIDTNDDQSVYENEVRMQDFFGIDQLVGWAGFSHVSFEGSTHADLTKDDLIAESTVVGAIVGTSGDDRYDPYNGTPQAPDLIGNANVADIIFGREGRDRLWGKSGNDVLYGEVGADILLSAGSDDLLFGDSGNDTIDAGSGYDIADGGAGKDGYQISYNHDTLLINNLDVTTPEVGCTGSCVTATDYLWISSQLPVDQVWFARKGASHDDLHVYVGNDVQGSSTETAEVIIPGYFDGTFAPLLELNIRYSVVPDGLTYDGSETNTNNYPVVWDGECHDSTRANPVFEDTDADPLVERWKLVQPGCLKIHLLEDMTNDDVADCNAAAADDWLVGFSDDDVIDANCGNDFVNGDNGADTLIGGLGNDILHGERDGDTYQFSTGDGVDTINDECTWFGCPNDVLDFTTITIDNIYFRIADAPSDGGNSNTSLDDDPDSDLDDLEIHIGSATNAQTIWIIDFDTIDGKIEKFIANSGINSIVLDDFKCILPTVLAAEALPTDAPLAVTVSDWSANHCPP